MSEHKVIGGCTRCDERCFEVLAMHEAHERRPGEPKQLGKPVEGAVRIEFMLFDGAKTSLTFCANCSTGKLEPDFTALWQKNLRSWGRELAEKPEAERMPDWYKKQFANGLLCEMGRVLWSEAVRNG